MESRRTKIYSSESRDIILRIYPGHYATSHSHINTYIDITGLKTRQKEARAVAASMVKDYALSTIVDTIVCMDGMEVVGAFLADELANAGYHSMNAHETIYVVSPEFDSSGQLIFRDNIQPTIYGKNVLLLLASTTTGRTIERSIQALRYYGANLQGISAIFSAMDHVDDYDIHAIFHKQDIPGYGSYSYSECPYCKKKVPIDAIVNGFGYSKL